MDKTIFITFPCTLGEFYNSVKSAIENDKMDKCKRGLSDSTII